MSNVDTQNLIGSLGLNVYNCPLEDGYSFVSFCAIKSCKYYTTETHNRCILLAGRLSGLFSDTSRISDIDLLRWKGRLLNIDTIKDLKQLRKDAIKQVNSIIVLDRYLRYLEERRPYCRIRRPCSLRIAYELLFNTFPFTLPDLVFKDWMAIYLFSEETYAGFYQRMYTRFCSESVHLHLQNQPIKSDLDVEKTIINKGKKSQKKTAKAKAVTSDHQANAKQIAITELSSDVKPRTRRNPSKPKTLDLRLYDLCFMKRKPWEDLRNQVISCGSSLSLPSPNLN